MSKLSLVIRRSLPNADGSFNIKLAVAHKSSTVYMSTKFKVDNANQFINGRVCGHPMAKELNRSLSAFLWQCENILDEVAGLAATAVELREYISKKLNQPNTLSDYAAKYIEQLQSNNQISYARNMGYTKQWLEKCFGTTLRLKDVSYVALQQFDKYLSLNGQSSTTINIRMSHLKALLNSAVNEGLVEYKVFPFRNYRMPYKNVRDLCLSASELAALREATFEGVSARRYEIARDLFMLSFYCAGINLTDLLDAEFDRKSGILTFVRKKTAARRASANNAVSITIQPEAWAILDKYLDDDGKIASGYQYRDYEQSRSYVTKSLNRIGEQLGFDKRLMFYSARKTFVQIGSELGIPLYILEYAIGQTIKESKTRPIFNYLKTMRWQADLAIRTIIDQSLDTSEQPMPLPEWARRS